MPLQRRLPKFGFNSRLARITAEVRLNELAKVEGEVVDVAALQKANVVGRNIKRVKVVASGKVERAFNLKGLGVTKGAREAIAAAGGTVEQ